MSPGSMPAAAAGAASSDGVHSWSDVAAPAAAGGIDVGDVVVTYDGTDTTSSYHLSGLIRGTASESR